MKKFTLPFVVVFALAAACLAGQCGPLGCSVPLTYGQPIYVQPAEPPILSPAPAASCHGALAAQGCAGAAVVRVRRERLMDRWRTARARRLSARACGG